MSILSINTNLKSEISIKESIGSLIGNSIQTANIVVQGINLSTVYGVAYMIQEMSDGKTQLEYNPINGQLGIKA